MFHPIRSFTLFLATAILVVPLVASAQTYYTNHSDWLAAAGGTTNVTVFHFDNPTETTGKFANDPTIIPSYSSQGVDFLPYRNTNVYPFVLRGQGGQIADPNRDGLLANNNSPNPTSDLDGRAIRFQFNRPEKSVGVYTNIGDGGFIRAFDTSMNLIGETPVSSSGGFMGLVSNVEIGRVDIVNTFNSDINFGIYDLQFSPVPAPSALAAFLIGAVPGVIMLRRRRK